MSARFPASSRGGDSRLEASGAGLGGGGARFRFGNFAEALSFTNRVGRLAEDGGHHPAILTEWRSGQGTKISQAYNLRFSEDQ